MTLSTRTQFLHKPVPAYRLAIFRMVYGAFMLWEIGYLFAIDFVGKFLTGPEILFPYDGFGWMPLLPGPALWLLIFVLGLACLALIAGWAYRPAALVLGFGFGYLFFLDKSIYNNHLYLLILLAFQLYFIEGDRVLAVQARDKKDGITTVPYWMYFLLMAQVFIVYFYGGLAKLNSDWLLHQQPALELLKQGSFFSDLIGIPAAAFILVWGGLIFDLVIGFLLFWRRTFWLAVAGVVFFNVMNSQLFDDINIFPYFMLTSLILFAPDNWIQEQVLKRWPAPPAPKKTGKTAPVLPAPSPRIVLWLSIYFGFQLLFPFRHLLVPGNADWTMEMQRFSWRMKVQHRSHDALAFRVMDYSSQTIYPVDLRTFKLNTDQIKLLSNDPAAAWRFAVYLRKFFEKQRRGARLGVQANVRVGMNGRAPQHVFNPEFDLGNAKRSIWGRNDWILPLEGEPRK